MFLCGTKKKLKKGCEGWCRLWKNPYKTFIELQAQSSRVPRAKAKEDTTIERKAQNGTINVCQNLHRLATVFLGIMFYGQIAPK